MAENEISDQSLGRPVSDVARGNRLNHLSYGHLGRITYVPASGYDEEQGLLHTSRRTDSPPHYRQIVSYEQLRKPTKSPSMQYTFEPSRSARSQKNWLLRSNPEAFMGSDELSSILPKEVASLRSDRGNYDLPAAAPTGPLLAVGEVTDTRSDYGRSGHLAVAMAAGVSGHILQIHPLTNEKRDWARMDLSLILRTTKQGEVGEWDANGDPISSIKFVESSHKWYATRWILVQKTTSTTILGPEIRHMDSTGQPSGKSAEKHNFEVFANPLCTIPVEKTGGHCHSDMAFKPPHKHADGKFSVPQLVIIDDDGSWSIWDIVGGGGKVRGMNLRPILIISGKFYSGFLQGLSPSREKPKPTYKALWVSSTADLSMFHDDSTEEDDQAVVERPGNSTHSNIEDDPSQALKYLLLCSNTTVRVSNISDGDVYGAITVARSNRAETILDVKLCPFDPTSVFVLTNTTLFWIEFCMAAKVERRLSVIMSWPHFQQTNNGFLMLSISPTTNVDQRPACFVCIHTSQTGDTRVYWVLKSTAHTPAQFVSQTMNLDVPGGICSMTISALPPVTVRSAMMDEDVQASRLLRSDVYQALTLGTDLRLGALVFSWSPTSLGDIPAPATVTGAQRKDQKKQRRTFLRHYGDAFVIPDQITELVGVDMHRINGSHSLSNPALNTRFKLKTVEFVPVVDWLLRTMYSRVSQVSQEHSTANVIATLREKIEALSEANLLPLRLLYELIGAEGKGVKFTLARQQCQAFLDDLPDGVNGRMIERRAFSFSTDRRSLIKVLEDLIPLIPEDWSDESQAVQENILRQALPDMQLSLICMSISPTHPSISSDNRSSMSTRDTSSSHLQSTAIPSGTSFAIRSASQANKGKTPVTEPNTVDDQSEETVVGRLREYLPRIQSPKRAATDKPLRLLSNWSLGSNPWDYTWKSEEVRVREKEMTKRMEAQDARRQKKERLLASLRRDRGLELSSTQPVAPTPGMFSSQAIPAGSQASTSTAPPMTMSQVVPGPHAGRPAPKKGKKGGKASGFR